jgi:hypothetical protein
MTDDQTTSQWRPPIGASLLGPSGRIWTVRAITSRGDRVVLTSPSPHGEHGAVVDLTAVSRMIPLDATTSTQPSGPTSSHPSPAGALVVEEAASGHGRGQSSIVP